MTDRQRIEDQEQRERIYRRDGGQCVNCGAALDITNYHRAHIIPQRKHWIRKYGGKIIHHDANMQATCPNDICNNAVSLGNNLHLIEQHAEMIREKILYNRLEPGDN